jgi:hypothetical protein
MINTSRVTILVPCGVQTRFVFIDSYFYIRGPATKSPPHFCFLKKDGHQIEQQNPKCQQFLLVATCQAPENHGCTLCCGFSTPNPLVFFPMGQFARTRLDSSDLEPIFGLESVVHGGPLQHVL